MSYFQIEGGAKAGFTGGTLLSVLMSVRMDQLVESALYAILGTAVSFFVSLGLRFLLHKMKRKR